jgi:tetratricopeptide (TPR) repeat protein
VYKVYSIIQKKLLNVCPYLKELLMTNNQKFDNSYSDKKKARAFYLEGEKHFDSGKYDLALVEYNKAVKADPKFAFAWDNLGICYRKLNRYKEAVKCYDESLKLDPKGTVPLQNKAVALTLLEDHKGAAETYMKLVEYYPDDAEGYYGAGRSFFFNKDYEKGLEYIFQAYIIYKNTDSPYVHDAQTNIAAFYKEMKDKNQLAIFDKAAKKYNIQIQE